MNKHTKSQFSFAILKFGRNYKVTKKYSIMYLQTIRFSK